MGSLVVRRPKQAHGSRPAWTRVRMGLRCRGPDLGNQDQSVRRPCSPSFLTAAQARGCNESWWDVGCSSRGNTGPPARAHIGAMFLVLDSDSFGRKRNGFLSCAQSKEADKETDRAPAIVIPSLCPFPRAWD